MFLRELVPERIFMYVHPHKYMHTYRPVLDIVSAYTHTNTCTHTGPFWILCLLSRATVNSSTEKSLKSSVRYVHTHIHVRMHTCMHLYMYIVSDFFWATTNLDVTCMHLCMCIVSDGYVSMHVSVYVSRQVCMYICTYACTHGHILVHADAYTTSITVMLNTHSCIIYMHIRRHIYTYILMHTHTRIHTCRPLLRSHAQDRVHAEACTLPTPWLRYVCACIYIHTHIYIQNIYIQVFRCIYCQHYGYGMYLHVYICIYICIYMYIQQPVFTCIYFQRYGYGMYLHVYIRRNTYSSV
jgi:hypothetical protein